MDAIVICGGKGTRVQSITNDEIPKILIPVNGKPFLEHLIENLYSQGVRNMVLAAGFKGEVLNDYLTDRTFRSDVNPWMRLSVVLEDQPLDTAGAILNVLDQSGRAIHSNPFLIVNGDCMILPDGEDCLEEFYYRLFDTRTACAMFTCRKEHDGRYGSLTLTKYTPFNGGYDQDIAGFENGKPGKSWINCGWYIVRHELFNKYHNPICNRNKIQIYDVQKLSMEKDIFPVYLEEGNIISSIMINEEQFLEIGTPEALADAERRLRFKEF